MSATALPIVTNIMLATGMNASPLAILSVALDLGMTDADARALARDLTSDHSPDAASIGCSRYPV